MKNVMKTIAAMMLMTVTIFAIGCTKSDDPNNGGDNNGGNNGGGNQSHHEYVDLGLPSGTLWATCNVGATTPEGYGDYFAWGETSPKSTYNWSTYKYCNGTNNTLTKYCDYSDYGYNGFTDNLIILQTSDDAATANWGSEWSTPIKEQWKELIENTTSTWTIRNDVYCRVFSANGQKLILPAAGDFKNEEIGWVGVEGLYWSRSLRNYSQTAWLFDFDDLYYGVFDAGYFERCYGASVRPVRSAK